MKFRENRQQSAELELAPMIDVVFLLLIFFIVTWKSARFERDISVSTPAAENAENTDRQVGEIIVNVRADGTIVLNGAEITSQTLSEKLQSISESFPDQAVILRGDQETPYQAIITVLDNIKKAGIWNVAFATVKPE